MAGQPVPTVGTFKYLIMANPSKWILRIALPLKTVLFTSSLVLSPIKRITLIFFPWPGYGFGCRVANFISSAPTGIEQIIRILLFDDTGSLYTDSIPVTIPGYFRYQP